MLVRYKANLGYKASLLKSLDLSWAFDVGL